VRALVTGASGFVAGWLRRHLEACGDEIVPVDESIDIADGPALTAKVVASAPDVIYHLAAFSHVGQSWEEPRETFRVNAVGTLELLHAAMACVVPPRVLLVGSAEVYGSVTAADLPLTEASPLRPVSPYAASKVAAEYLGLQAYLGHGLPVMSIRAFNHIGPGQNANFAVPAFARRIIDAQAEGQPFLAVGNVSARRDFTDVRDVVRAYRLLAEQGRPGEAYNVCSGQDVSIEEVARRLLALAGADLELRVDPELVRPVEVPVLLGDASKLVAVTGWRPEHDMDETLADVLADLRARSGAG